MKKGLLVLMMVLCINAINVYGQAYYADTFGNYGPGSLGAGGPFSNSYPQCKFYTTYTYQPTELASKGIVPGTVIFGTGYHKMNVQNFPQGNNSILEIGMRCKPNNDTCTSNFIGSSFYNYASLNTLFQAYPSYMSYFVSPTFYTPTNIGWVPLMLDVPFVYTGGAIEVITKFDPDTVGLNYTMTYGFSHQSGNNCNYEWGQGINCAGYGLTGKPTTLLFHSIAPPLCNGVPNGGVIYGNQHICANVDYTLYLGNQSAGTGITYQWQQKPVASGTWNNISGATNVYYTINISTPTVFRCMVTCINSGLSASSTNFTVNPETVHIDSISVAFNANQAIFTPHLSDTAFVYYYSIQWGDGTSDNYTLAQSHNYNIDSTYTAVFTVNTMCGIHTYSKTFTIGCIGSSTFIDTISANKFVSCPGGQVTLSVQDTLPANYNIEWQAFINWNWTTLSGLTGSPVIVSPTANIIYRNKATCTISGNFKYSNFDTIWVTYPPIAGNITATNTTTNYYNFTNSGMSNVQSYKWYFGDGDSSSSLAPSHHYNLAGTYNVWFVVTNAGNGCTDTAFTTVTITTGIDETQPKLFSIAPNPFNESFVVACPDAKGSLMIVDGMGKVVKSVVVKSANMTIDLKGFAAGVYLVKYDDGIVKETAKVVKE